MKSSEVAFRRSGSDDELLRPENSDKPPPWSGTVAAESMGDAMSDDQIKKARDKKSISLLQELFSASLQEFVPKSFILKKHDTD